MTNKTKDGMGWIIILGLSFIALYTCEKELDNCREAVKKCIEATDSLDNSEFKTYSHCIDVCE